MTVEDLWQQHRSAKFPGELRGHDVAGIDFVMLDADIAGCVSTFLTRKHVLDHWRTAVLGVSLGNVERLLPNLEPAQREYFERLASLARLILREVAAITKDG
jgi:hypothetical protein